MEYTCTDCGWNGSDEDMLEDAEGSKLCPDCNGEEFNVAKG